MKLSKLFLAISILTIGNGMPVHAAALGLQSKAVVALCAAAGSVFATGLKAIADEIKDDKVAQANKIISDLQADNDYLKVRLNNADTIMQSEGLAACVIICGILAVTVISLALITTDSQQLAQKDINDKNAMAASQNQIHVAAN